MRRALRCGCLTHTPVTPDRGEKSMPSISARRALPKPRLTSRFTERPAQDASGAKGVGRGAGERLFLGPRPPANHFALEAEGGGGGGGVTRTRGRGAGRATGMVGRRGAT